MYAAFFGWKIKTKTEQPQWDYRVPLFHKHIDTACKIKYGNFAKSDSARSHPVENWLTSTVILKTETNLRPIVLFK